MFWNKPKGPSPMDEFNQRLIAIEQMGQAVNEANTQLRQDKAQLETEKQALAESVETLQQKVTELVTEADKRVETLQQKVTELVTEADKRKARYDVNAPWIEIVSEGFDESKGIKIALDWNDGMIQMLKDNGLEGVSEEDIIRKYIAFLYEDIVSRLEKSVEAQADSKGKIKDYE